MRSGTTFLANFLNSQKDCVVYADMLVSLFMEAHALGIHDIKKILTTREKNILLSNLIQEGKLHNLDFSTIDRKETLSWWQMFLEALEIVKADKSATVVGIKRTREEEYLPQLLAMGVKVIYCVRDPRDVVISAQNRFARFNLFRSAENWQRSYRFARSLEYFPNFKLLRYEDLILNKENTAEKLSSFLSLKVITTLENLSFGHHLNYRDNSSFGDVSKLFDPTATYRWKSNPDNAEIHFIDRLLVKEMNELEYEKGNMGTKTGTSLWSKYKLHKQKEALMKPLKKLYFYWLR